jgi:4a-hydroxytetrahydrobiopterin dehydratase
MARLTKSEVLEGLKNLTGWRLDKNAIEKEYQFQSFPNAMKFVNKVAKISEKVDHHPDILIRFRKVTLRLSTHDDGGITQKDFQLAGTVEKAKGERTKGVE